MVLDDVLSELDADGAGALLRHLPSGQVVITTAAAVPPAATWGQFRIIAGMSSTSDDQPLEAWAHDDPLPITDALDGLCTH